MTRLFRCMVFVAAAAITGLLRASAADAAKVPPTAKKPVTDTYHGVSVVDDYRWLEKVDDPAVQDWIAQQNRVTRAHLDHISLLPSLREQLKKLMADPQPRYYGLEECGGKLFGFKDQPPAEQPVLIVLESPDDPAGARVIVDPSQLDSTGKTTIDFFEPSRDSKLVAVSISQGGSEDGTLHLYDVASGKKLNDVIPRVNYPTAGGCVSWNADNSGFYYARLPHEGERPKEDLNFYQQVYYHKLGTPSEADTYVIGKEFPRIAEVFLDSSPDGRYLLVTVQNGDSGKFEHHLLDPKGKWTPLTTFDDQINAAAFGAGDDATLYLVSYKNAPKGKILRLPLNDLDLSRATTAGS